MVAARQVQRFLPLPVCMLVKHQIVSTDSGASYGLGITAARSEWMTIDSLPGRAMLAEKFDTM